MCVCVCVCVYVCLRDSRNGNGRWRRETWEERRDEKVSTSSLVSLFPLRVSAVYEPRPTAHPLSKGAGGPLPHTAASAAGCLRLGPERPITCASSLLSSLFSSLFGSFSFQSPSLHLSTLSPSLSRVPNAKSFASLYLCLSLCLNLPPVLQPLTHALLSGPLVSSPCLPLLPSSLFFTLRLFLLLPGTSSPSTHSLYCLCYTACVRLWPAPAKGVTRTSPVGSLRGTLLPHTLADRGRRWHARLTSVTLRDLSALHPFALVEDVPPSWLSRKLTYGAPLPALPAAVQKADGDVGARALCGPLRAGGLPLGVVGRRALRGTCAPLLAKPPLLGAPHQPRPLNCRCLNPSPRADGPRQVQHRRARRRGAWPRPPCTASAQRHMPQQGPSLPHAFFQDGILEPCFQLPAPWVPSFSSRLLLGCTILAHVLLLLGQHWSVATHTAPLSVQPLPVLTCSPCACAAPCPHPLPQVRRLLLLAQVFKGQAQRGDARED